MNRRNDLLRKTLAGLGIYTVMILALPAPEAGAIPAFARKYGLSCSTCHAPVPRLKPYGEDFAGNGFQLPDDQEPVRAFRDVGDEWLLLQRELPVAIRLDGYYKHGFGNEEFSDLETPWALKLMSGGAIAPNIGYYLYFYLSERGEVAGIEDGYIHFNNLGGTSLDIMVGQFQISDPLMKRELRLTYEDYMLYKVSPGFSLTNLTYDRGLMMTYDLPFGLGLVGQVVNGNGKPEADTRGTARLYDVDRDKGYSLRGMYEIGPLGVGAFYYGTREAIDFPGPGGMVTNEVAVYGPDANLSLLDGRLTVTAQYLMRTDSQPDPALTDAETEGYIGEVVFLPQGENGRMALIGLYNRVTSDDAAIAYESVSAAATYLVVRNLRLMGEITRDIEVDSTRLILGFVSGF